MKIIGFLLLLTACYEGELERTNPFDPENPTTHGNPFELEVQSETDGVQLTWNTPGGEVV